MPVCDNKKIIFIHIPKNAGTSITSVLDINPYTRGHHLPEWYMKNFPEQWKTYKKIAIVRNPYSRVISNYNYARLTKSYWHSSTGRSREGKHLDFDILTNLSISECIDLLIDNKLKHQGWKHQYIYTHIDNKCVVDYIFKYETFNDSKLFKNLIQLDIPVINKTTSNINTYRDILSKQDIDKITNYYEYDIKCFNYENKYTC